MPAVARRRPPTLDLRISVPVRARAERLYEALTSARELCLWLAERAETDARSLGRLRLVLEDEDCLGAREAVGAFVDLDPGRKVAWLWEADRLPKGMPALTNFFIEPRGRGCLVTLMSCGYPARRAGASRAAWEARLAGLKRYAEMGRAREGRRPAAAGAGR